MDPFIELSGISKTYSGVEALSRVDFTVAKGEVHCLVGENGSGKSTLIKIMAGIVHPDPAGSITIDRQHFRRLTAIDSMSAGVQVIYQDLSLFPNLTVAENIAVNQYLEENRRIFRRNEIRQIAKHTMGMIGTELDPSTLVGALPIAKQQLVAICRAITRGEQLIIMDEPTSSLGKKDIDYLFSIIRNLKERGISVLFVGHKLNEVLEIADRVTILRDGVKVGTFPAAELNNDRLIELMTGRKIHASRSGKTARSTKPLLEIRNFTKKGQFADICFQLHEGEVLGMIGLVGAGRTELALSIFGLNEPDAGDVLIQGERRDIRSVQEAMNLGIGYVPEDRLTQGLFMEHTISKNMIVTLLDALLGMFHLLDKKRIRNVNDRWIEELDIKTPSSQLAVKQLSGGNQQRVVLSKWLERNPKILILDGPTIGIDIGAKEEIHALIQKLAANGMGIIMISDEASEIVQYANRFLLLREGRIAQEFEAGDITESELLKKLGEK